MITSDNSLHKECKIVRTVFCSVNFFQDKGKQEVQELEAFAFCVINVNDEHAKPKSKRKLRFRLLKTQYMFRIVF